jgi:predicted acyl esterase
VVNNGRTFVLFLSALGLLAAWALTIEAHFDRQRVLIDPNRAADLSIEGQASWEDVSIRAADHVWLRGWLFIPVRGSRPAAVLLVHGGRLSREQMVTRARWFLKAGYACLLIDQRGCGASGGIVSYGIHEPGDIAAWAKWLRHRTGATRVSEAWRRGRCSMALQPRARAQATSAIRMSPLPIGWVSRSRRRGSSPGR